MSGRFSLTADLGELARRFEFEGNWLELAPNYNVAPTQNVLTVIDDGENQRGGFTIWRRNVPMKPLLSRACLDRIQSTTPC